MTLIKVTLSNYLRLQVLIHPPNGLGIKNYKFQTYAQTQHIASVQLH
jgi:hypothetical protein